MGRQKNITQTSRYVSARIPHDVARELDRRAPTGSRSAFIVGAVRAALAADTASQDYRAGYEAGRLAGRREGVDDAIEFIEQQQARERRLVAETMRAAARPELRCSRRFCSATGTHRRTVGGGRSREDLRSLRAGSRELASPRRRCPALRLLRELDEGCP